MMLCKRLCSIDLFFVMWFKYRKKWGKKQKHAGGLRLAVFFCSCQWVFPCKKQMTSLLRLACHRESGQWTETHGEIEFFGHNWLGPETESVSGICKMDAHCCETGLLYLQIQNIPRFLVETLIVLEHKMWHYGKFMWLHAYIVLLLHSWNSDTDVFLFPLFEGSRGPVRPGSHRGTGCLGSGLWDGCWSGSLLFPGSSNHQMFKRHQSRSNFPYLHVSFGLGHFRGNIKREVIFWLPVP